MYHNLCWKFRWIFNVILAYFSLQNRRYFDQKSMKKMLKNESKKNERKKYEFWTCLSIGTGSALHFWNFQSWWRMWKWFKRVETCASACLRGDGQSLQTCSRASLSLKSFQACSAKQAEHAKEAKQDKQAGCYVLLCSAICCCCVLLPFASICR